MKGTLFVFFVVVSFSLAAQTPVQNFALTNVADGSPLSLETYSNVAIIFTSNNCPYDKYYLDRIKGLVKLYDGKIQFLLVNSYQEPEENFEKMKEAFVKWGIPVPYLSDKDQIAMRFLGAKKSPEVFLLRGSGKSHYITYSGAIDDNPQIANAVSQNYLKEAIDKLLAGSNADTPVVRAIGCTIRRK